MKLAKSVKHSMINKNLHNRLLANNFSIINQSVSQDFGDCFYIYSDGSVDIRFLSDRSVKSIEIKRGGNGDQWFDLSLIKALIGKNDKSEHGDDKFLEEYIATICRLFDDEEYFITNKKLMALLRCR